MSLRPSNIVHLTGRQILDSRGRPTVEADVRLADGSTGRASVPSGTSTGRYEASELRDGDPTVFRGRGVHDAVQNIREEIARSIVGVDALEQSGVDGRLISVDGTPALKRLGANAVLATSLAVARAAAAHLRRPLHEHISHLAGGTPMSLPMPITNVISGGAHVRRGLDFQDFLVVPVGARSYSHALAILSDIRDAALGLIDRENVGGLLAEDGGLIPGFVRTEQALELLVRAIESASYRPSIDAAIALDAAASELYSEGHYSLNNEGTRFSSEEMIDYLSALTTRFPIISLEDGLDQDAWDCWRDLTGRLPGIQIMGDDLFATNLSRVQRGIGEGAANAALIKLNQNGTLTGTLAVLTALRSAGFGAAVAGRSGDTEDTFIADLVVGTGAGQVKIGPLRGSERMCKYNHLLRLEEQTLLPFAGTSRMSRSA